jgi:hypothetical protein
LKENEGDLKVTKHNTNANLFTREATPPDGVVSGSAHEEGGGGGGGFLIKDVVPLAVKFDTEDEEI